MVMIRMHSHHHHHHHQITPPPHPSNPPLTSPISHRSPNSSSTPTPTPTPTAQPYSFNSLISLGSGPGQESTSAAASAPVLTRVRLSEILPHDGAPTGSYARAVEALSGSLMRHNAAVIEVGSDDAALLRCGLDSARFFFRTRPKGSRGVYFYRPGRAFEDKDSPPPCMDDVFRCMGKAARAALCAIARHLRLRSDAFNHLLDDSPLPANESSSSMLMATFSNTDMHNGKASVSIGKHATNGDIEKGLLALISSNAPGLQVCDPNGRWYLADNGLFPGDLLLLTGKALSHVTAGLRPGAIYRSSLDNSSGTPSGGRISLAFKFMPQSNAMLDCSPIAAAGHIIPQSYVPISVAQFMDELSLEENILYRHTDSSNVVQDNLTREPSLRSVLSDSLSGAFLEDAMLVSCGHSFGGLMLRRVIDMSRCTLCNSEIDTRSLIPNHALRAAAAAVKQEDERRMSHYAGIRKRGKDIRDYRENGDIPSENGPNRGVTYPFAVHERVIIRGNRRTPDKFVGKEAVITSQCLNGWYLLKILDTGEHVRLQYRSLRKFQTSLSQEAEEGTLPLPVQNSSS